MKLMKVALRFWIALTSVVSFLIGWAMLAHSPKPVQAKSQSSPSASVFVTPLPTLAPLPSMDFSGTSNNGGFQVPPVTIQQPPPPVVFSQAPVFSSGGS